MKNLTILASFLLLTVSLRAQTQGTETKTDSSITTTQNTENEVCEAKQNGIYYSKYDSTTNIYIKFYSKDSVVTTSSVNNISIAQKFITPALGKEALFGKFLLNQNTCNVRVKAKNDFAKVKMDGIIRGSNLVLNVINLDENTARDFVFFFAPYKKQ